MTSRFGKQSFAKSEMSHGVMGMLSSHSGCVKKVQLGYLKYAVGFLTMWVELVKSVSSVMWAILDSMASVELLEVT